MRWQKQEAAGDGFEEQKTGRVYKAIRDHHESKAS
jgi:hypothetical protein